MVNTLRSYYININNMCYSVFFESDRQKCRWKMFYRYISVGRVHLIILDSYVITLGYTLTILIYVSIGGYSIYYIKRNIPN